MALRILARGSASVPDYVKLANSIKAGVPLPAASRLIGRDFVLDESGKTMGSYPAKPVPTEVPDVHEYRQHVIEGSLWAADEATAEACGVKFDPTFGGEFKAHERAASTEPAPELVPAVTEPAEPTPPAAA